MGKGIFFFEELTFDTFFFRIFAVVKIEDAIQQFADYIATEQRLAEGTIQYYLKVTEWFGLYLSSQEIHTIEEIEPRDIRAWQMGLIEDGKSPGTVTKHLAAIRAWFKYLRKNGYMQRDIMAKISPPKAPKRLPVFFKEKDVEKIYSDIYPDTYEGVVEKLVLRMLYETGMRRSELASLSLANIDIEGCTIKVRGKRNKERYIPIENELAHNISQYIALRSRRMMELHEEQPNLEDTDRLLVNNKGKAISDSAIYNIVEKYMTTLAHAERYSPHVFRHSFATHMLNEGANIDAIKELLGHSDLAATEVYTHVTREHLKETYKHAHPRANKK